RIIRCTLKEIAEKVKEAGIKKTALIYVGEALKASEGGLNKESRLYHKDFKHEYRK
ncbi:MAG TPA: cobalt-precorrin-4 C(11)-methyltransferase, partial [Nitrospirae bacterium]|nr:cobalt-precorrin-4 C(11)-methyltransferase [Nitrospirota bacterium]